MPRTEFRTTCITSPQKMTSTPSIPEFYAGKNIFITGATGFLGKALIEKLLRNCPQIGDIYILIRPKRGKDIQERIEELSNDPLYERVKHEQPNLQMEKKIKPLAGDIKQLNLGLSPEDRRILVERVNIIFHVAASVRFDDFLYDAVMMNVRGTREVCQLALDAKHLVTYIHVSTAFVNCDRRKVEEVLYPAKMDWRQLIEIAEKFDKGTLAVLTEKIMDGIPNTYCFTKSIAEHVAYDMMVDRKPCKIFRPSIVISSMHDEPVKGWIDNYNGPVGILVAYGKGIMRTIYSAARYKPDYIPVDVVTKALIVSTWDLSVRAASSKAILEPEVLHATSHSADWLRFNAETLSNTALSVNKEIPFNGCVWIPEGHNTGSVFVWYMRSVLFMLLPSLIVDGILLLAGKKPLLTKLQKKIFGAQIALRYFMNNEWDYHNDQLLALQGRIQEGDKQNWDYEFHDYDFTEYMRQFILGVRRYLLKEPDSTIEQARRHHNRMWWLAKIVWLGFLALCFLGIWKLGVGSHGITIISL